MPLSLHIQKAGFLMMQLIVCMVVVESTAQKGKLV